MSSQRVNLGIDTDVYLLAKQEKVNMSQLVSRLLREYFKNESNLHANEAQILEDIDVDRRKVNELQERISQKTVLLVHLREQREKQKKQQFEKGVDRIKTIKNSGLMEELA